MQNVIWLALGYNVPANPSKNRVYVWRKLKELGAGYFRPGVAILPKSPQSMAQFRNLAGKIRDLGGDASIVEMRFCDLKDEAMTIKWFEEQSEQEFRELLRDCADAAQRLASGMFAHESSGKGEYMEYMRKMSKRYGKAKSRDFFSSAKRAEINSGFDELLGDMANVTGDLKKQLAKFFSES